MGEFSFLGGTVVYVGQLFHAGHSRVKFGAHSLLQWREPRMSSNLACFVESRKHFWIYYVSSSLVHFPGHKSDQNLSQFLTSNFLLVLFSNCTKHSSFKTTNSLKITGQAVAWPAVWIWRHTHKDILTHTSGFSFECLSIYIYFPVHPHTHKIVFLSLLNLALRDHSHCVQVGQWIATCHQYN